MTKDEIIHLKISNSVLHKTIDDYFSNKEILVREKQKWDENWRKNHDKLLDEWSFLSNKLNHYEV